MGGTGRVAKSQLQDPELGLLSMQSLSWSPCVHVGFLWVLWFLPKNMLLGGMSTLKLPLGVNDWNTRNTMREINSYLI